jgi:integrase
MPQKTKGGLLPTHQPQKSYTDKKVQHKQKGMFQVINEASPALRYWQNELATKSEETKRMYEVHFAEFLDFIGKNPDELIVQRQQDLLNPDRKIQRTIESQFLAFIAKKKQEGYATATLQLMFASIRSFFEIHYFPLIMRRGDYPKGDSNGVKRATKDAILKIMRNDKARNKVTTKPAILFVKDSGLRISDVRRLNCDFFLQALEKDPDTELIEITLITQKTKLLAKTFIGKEAIEALKQYIQARTEGSRNVPPEIVTNESPLFKVWRSGRVRRISRHSFSTQLRQAFVNVGEGKMSAHSLRKKLQTDLEKAGINSNWIDQILGHQLINSRDAYSLPTDEELKEAYTRAYQYIKVYSETTTMTKDPPNQIATISLRSTASSEEDYQVAEARSMEEVKQLLAKGYKYEMEMEGVKLFVKK